MAAARDHGIEGVGEVDVEDLLALLDADQVHSVGPDEVGFSCFFTSGHAQGDRNPSAHINRDSHLWRCKGCGRAGNLLELVRLALPAPEGSLSTHVSRVEALRWLRESFGEASRRPVGGSLVADLQSRLERVAGARETPRRTLPEEAATIGPDGIFYVDWTSDHPAAEYMRGRGFAPEVLADWGVGYDSWTQRVAIPVRDETGLLVGFKGRALRDGGGKYLLLGDTKDRAPRYGVGYGFDMHDARTVVFGLDRAIRSGNDPALVPMELCGQSDVRDVRPGQRSSANRRIALVEGELNAIACHAAGVPAAAPGTTSITAEQLWLLRAHVDELVNFYDSDMAGENAVWGYADEGKWRPGLMEKIYPYFRLYVVDDHEGDPASMSAQEIRDLYEGASHWLRYAAPSEASV